MERRTRRITARVTLEDRVRLEAIRAFRRQPLSDLLREGIRRVLDEDCSHNTADHPDPSAESTPEAPR